MGTSKAILIFLMIITSTSMLTAIFFAMMAAGDKPITTLSGSHPTANDITSNRFTKLAGFLAVVLVVAAYMLGRR